MSEPIACPWVGRGVQRYRQFSINLQAPSFAQAIERTEESVRLALSRLVAKYGRALGQRDQVTAERLDRLRTYLLPDGAPQERIYGLPYYACRFGARAFTRMVLEACEPFSGGLKDLKP